jgi:DNA polymerase I-like protein with 3'-5' exonuclease and polymerase domains
MSQIYLVTTQKQLFDNNEYKIIGIEESLSLLSSCNFLQFDTETDGKDAHINKLLLIQFGNKENDFQIVVDATTIDILKYKDILETKYLIGQNLKFDLQFLYNYGIKPQMVYDTMIVEQFLHLGYPSGVIHYSLADIALRRLNIYIDKTVRGEIIWRGIDTKVIIYAANDVKYLEDIMWSQLKDCRERNCLKGAKLECDFTPCIAYLEWCGIKLDEGKWKAKMNNDKIKLEETVKTLNDYCISNPKLQKWVYINRQGSLFDGFDTTPKFNIDWQKDEAKQVFKTLGFNLDAISKTTGEETESVTEKVIKVQKGIDDTFLKLYLDYQGYYKVITSFGQGHLNAINPKTGRLHTTYRAIGTVSGRMASGNKQNNNDLAKYKGLPVNPSNKQKREGLGCSYPNMQQLPHDEVTRGCFVSEKGNLFCSCDFSAMEARIGAEVYNEHKLLDEFLYGSGDSHAAYAKVVYVDELKDIETKDIKKKRPDLRNSVKSIEFAVQFGSDGTAVAPQLGITKEAARTLVNNLLNGMSGLKSFKERGSKFVMSHGYVEIMPETGHRAYWWDWKDWLERQKTFTSDFWEDYRLNHKGKNDDVCKKVTQHFQAKSKWCDRMSLNLPTQGGGAIVLKEAVIALYKWIIDNGYWGKILFCNFTHDEINSEFPEELKDTYPNIVSKIMQEAAAKYYHKLPIPAEPAVGDHWIH